MNRNSFGYLSASLPSVCCMPHFVHSDSIPGKWFHRTPVSRCDGMSVGLITASCHLMSALLAAAVVADCSRTVHPSRDAALRTTLYWVSATSTTMVGMIAAAAVFAAVGVEGKVPDLTGAADTAAAERPPPLPPPPHRATDGRLPAARPGKGFLAGVADDAADTEVEEEAGAGVAGPRPPLSLPPPEAAGAFRRVLMEEGRDAAGVGFDTAAVVVCGFFFRIDAGEQTASKESTSIIAPPAAFFTLAGEGLREKSERAKESTGRGRCGWRERELPFRTELNRLLHSFLPSYLPHLVLRAASSVVYCPVFIAHLGILLALALDPLMVFHQLQPLV